MLVEHGRKKKEKRCSETASERSFNGAQSSSETKVKLSDWLKILMKIYKDNHPRLTAPELDG